MGGHTYRARALLVALLGSGLLMTATSTLAADCRSSSDCVPPVTTFTATGTKGENGWWRSDVVVTLVCTDDNSGCGSTQMSLDGSSFNAYNGPFAVGGDGLHFILAQSQDKNGNNENPEVLFLPIDSAAPRIAFASPTDGNAYVRDAQDPLDPALPATVVVGEDQQVTAALSDSLSGAGRVEFYVDGALRGAASTPFAVGWKAGDESLGPHTLTLRGFDVAGNSADATLKVLTVPTSTTGAKATADAAAATAQGLPGRLPPAPAPPPLPPLPPLPALPPLPGVGL